MRGGTFPHTDSPAWHNIGATIVQDAERTFVLWESNLSSENLFRARRRFIWPANYKLWECSGQHVEEEGYFETYLVQILASGRWLELTRVTDCESLEWVEEDPEGWIFVSSYREVANDEVYEWFVKNKLEPPAVLCERVAFEPTVTLRSVTSIPSKDAPLRPNWNQVTCPVATKECPSAPAGVEREPMGWDEDDIVIIATQAINQSCFWFRRTLRPAQD